jgi:hypothetical protein
MADTTIVTKEKILELIECKYDGFDVRLTELKCDFDIDDVDLSSKFYYLTFKNGQPSIDDFIDFIYWKVIYFCIPYSKRKSYVDKFKSTSDFRHWQELSDKAKELFIRAKTQQFTTGEPGELILFILLEAVMNAPQIVCKMHLKTSTNMPVHGSDAIHISYDEDTDMLCLYWGESKLRNEISTALDETCASIVNFISDTEAEAPRERDLEIIRDHITIVDDNLKAEILKYLDPYEPESNNIEECFACFVGFEYSLLSQLHALDKNQLVKQFESKYLERAISATKLFRDKIKEKNIKHLRFIFFLIPFKDLKELRSKFLKKLGVPE